MLIYDVTHYNIKHGITEKLQSLIVHGFSLCVAVHDALVHQRHLVIANFVWIKT